MRLTPRNTQFFDLFTTAAEHVLDATQVMAVLVAAEPSRRPELVRRMVDLEHAGDACVHEVMKALNTSFITPFDREDIALLAARLDDVLDELEEAAQLTELYRVGALPDGVRQQVALLERAAALTVPAMQGLASLSGLTDFWVGVNALENEADQVYRAALARLFDTETDAIALLKVKEVLDRLEEAADAFEHVANVVQSDRREGVLRRWSPSCRQVVLALVFDYTNGFHDAANAIASAVSTRALTPRAALSLAAAGNLVGALLSTGIATTIAASIIEPPPGPPGISVVLAALVGAIVWNFVTWYFGLPSSSSQALVGGLVGAGLASGSTVEWLSGVVGKVLVPMVVSPVIGLVGGYGLMLVALWACAGPTRTGSSAASGSRRSSRRPASPSATGCRTRRRAWGHRAGAGHARLPGHVRRARCG